MQVALDILYFWLPVTLAIFAAGWLATLAVRVRTKRAMVAMIASSLIVVVLSGISVYALVATRFYEGWPTFLPYIFVACALVIVGACHVTLARRVV
jgi:uncharacterized membrane protein (DUF485 family)